MPPSYPSSIKTWPPLQDNIDLALAAQINTIYDEVTAIQTILATDPQGSYASVKARLADLAGLIHASRHQLGGADVLNLTGLQGKSLYTPRGEPGAPDWTGASLTHDGVPHDLNTSAIVPAAALMVHLAVYLLTNNANKSIILFQKGTAGAYNRIFLRSILANIPLAHTGFVPLDANKLFSYISNNYVTGTLQITVCGWIT